MQKLATVDQMTFSYPSYGHEKVKYLFKDVSFSLYEGEMHIIFGEPESGKTTLSRIFTGLVPTYLGGRLSGSIRFRDEVEVTATSPNELTSRIGVVFQNPEEQILMAECEDEIIFPLENLGLSHKEIGERLETVLVRYDLVPYRHINPTILSGGEKKRLMLAVIDAINPDLWILDETFEELDAYWRKTICQYLKDTRKSVVLFASKDIELYQEFFDHWGIIQPQADGDGNTILFSDRDSVITAFSDDSQASYTKASVVYDAAHLICFADHISFHYKEQTRDFLLKVDDFKVYEGETVALYGPNGSGKSTLSKMLCGLVEPHAGTITISKHAKWLPAQSKDLLRYTGYLFQNPDYQIFLPTIEDELRYGLTQKGVHGVEAEKQIENTLELFDLGDPKEPPTIMSYGKRKQLQAAVYYLLDRRICILDELDSGLSHAKYMKIFTLLASKVDAVILITHDERLAHRCANRIVYMKEGRIVKGEHPCK